MITDPIKGRSGKVVEEEENEDNINRVRDSYGFAG